MFYSHLVEGAAINRETYGIGVPACYVVGGPPLSDDCQASRLLFQVPEKRGGREYGRLGRHAKRSQKSLTKRQPTRIQDPTVASWTLLLSSQWCAPNMKCFECVFASALQVNFIHGFKAPRKQVSQREKPSAAAFAPFLRPCTPEKCLLLCL